MRRGSIERKERDAIWRERYLLNLNWLKSMKHHYSLDLYKMYRQDGIETMIYQRQHGLDSKNAFWELISLVRTWRMASYHNSLNIVGKEDPADIPLSRRQPKGYTYFNIKQWGKKGVDYVKDMVKNKYSLGNIDV